MAEQSIAQSKTKIELIYVRLHVMPDVRVVKVTPTPYPGKGTTGYELIDIYVAPKMPIKSIREYLLLAGRVREALGLDTENEDNTSDLWADGRRSLGVPVLYYSERIGSVETRMTATTTITDELVLKARGPKEKNPQVSEEPVRTYYLYRRISVHVFPSYELGSRVVPWYDPGSIRPHIIGIEDVKTHIPGFDFTDEIKPGSAPLPSLLHNEKQPV